MRYCDASFFRNFSKQPVNASCGDWDRDNLLMIVTYEIYKPSFDVESAERDFSFHKPTLAAEQLESEDGLRVAAETLRRWMLRSNLTPETARHKFIEITYPDLWRAFP